MHCLFAPMSIFSAKNTFYVAVLKELLLSAQSVSQDDLCHIGMEDCRLFVCSHIWQGLEMLDLAGASDWQRNAGR